ncbi:MAG: OpgC domain-containing protein [Nitrospirota bacterium]|nr:OpgC domain-containing protein [Nitrospirota bacterium]
MGDPYVQDRRLFALDSARGMAMLLVCIAHFVDIFHFRHLLLEGPTESWIVDTLTLACRAASPMFVLISGVLLGYQAEVKGAHFAAFRMHVLDRALFLVTIGHVLIALSFAALWGLGPAMSQAYITDTVAFCVMIGVFVVPAIGRRIRFLLGGCLSIGSWILWLYWNPEDPLYQVIRSVLCGPTQDLVVAQFPLLPWLGVYMAGSGVGAWLKDLPVQGLRPVSRRLLNVSLGMIATAIVLKAGIVLLSLFGGVALDPGWRPYLSLYQKYPPGLVYLLVYGGAAFLLLGVLFAQTEQSWIRGGMRAVEPIGRNALPIFIVQFFLYYTCIYLLSATVTRMPLAMAGGLLLLSLWGIWGVARLCQRYNISRFLTTGLPRLLSRRDNRRNIIRHAAWRSA